MSLIKWNSFKDFMPMVPSFFDTMGFDDDFMTKFWNGNRMPAVNISETDDKFLLEVAAPGMEKKDFKVTVENGYLLINAEKEEKKEEKKKNFCRQEYSFEKFERRFLLPENVDAEHVKANYENGVLNIVLKKVEIEAPERVQVKVG